MSLKCLHLDILIKTVFEYIIFYAKLSYNNSILLPFYIDCNKKLMFNNIYTYIYNIYIYTYI